MKKTKKTEAASAEVQDQDDAMDVTLGEEEDVLANATFNDDEDEAIIKGMSCDVASHQEKKDSRLIEMANL